MPRIRNLTVAGVLAGATVLGGAGLAGATDGETEIEDPTAVIEDGEQTQRLTTSESDEAPDAGADETDVADEAPTAPELPDTAAERAHTALAEAPAFAEGDADSTQPEPEAAAEQQVQPEDGTEDTSTEGPKPDNHGQRVSEVARTTEPGPDHGPTVSEEAKKNGQGGERADEGEEPEED